MGHLSLFYLAFLEEQMIGSVLHRQERPLSLIVDIKLNHQVNVEVLEEQKAWTVEILRLC